MCSEKGFSLVELLVTIGIVGIMSSLAVSIVDELKMKAMYAEHHRYFDALEVAVEARDEQAFVSIAPGQYFRLRKNYSDPVVVGPYNTTEEEFAPGLPEHKSYFGLYAFVRNTCGGSPGCLLTQLIVTDCRTGMGVVSNHFEGSVPTELFYYHTIYDSAC